MGSKGKSPGYLYCNDSCARPRAATDGAQFRDVIPLAGNDKLLQAKTSPTAGEILPGPRKRSKLSPAQRLGKISQPGASEFQQKESGSSKKHVTGARWATVRAHSSEETDGRSLLPALSRFCGSNPGH